MADLKIEIKDVRAAAEASRLIAPTKYFVLKLSVDLWHQLFS